MKYQVTLKSKHLGRVVDEIEADDAKTALVMVALYLTKKEQDIRKNCGCGFESVNIKRIRQ